MSKLRVCLAMLVLAGSFAPLAGSTAIEDGASAEVRLRKMHLVRPDLIPYPVYQDYYA
jgi:hypothetical protein